MSLLNYTLRRILVSIPVLIAITLISFSIIHLAPGSPASTLLGEKAFNPEAVKKVEENLGLNKPLYEQYFRWFSQLLQGNLGDSIGIKPGTPVTALLGERIFPTLLLSLSAFFLALILAIPFGIFSALKHNSFFDKITSIFCFIAISIPHF